GVPRSGLASIGDCMKECRRETNKMADEAAEQRPERDWKTFLESTPPETLVTIPDAVSHNPSGHDPVNRPAVQFYCASDSCEDMMFFDWVETYQNLNPATVEYKPFKFQ